MGIFKKKFKVKVSYFAEGRYSVKYAHYRLIPIYHALHFWFEQSLTINTEKRSIDLFRVD